MPDNMPRVPSPAQLRILALIHGGTHTYRALADAYGCSVQAAFNFVQCLERAGCVRRKFPPGDGVYQLAVVTDYGRYRLMRKGLADSVCPVVEVRR